MLFKLSSLEILKRTDYFISYHFFFVVRFVFGYIHIYFCLVRSILFIHILLNFILQYSKYKYTTSHWILVKFIQIGNICPFYSYIESYIYHILWSSVFWVLLVYIECKQFNIYVQCIYAYNLILWLIFYFQHYYRIKYGRQVCSTI